MADKVWDCLPLAIMNEPLPAMTKGSNSNANLQQPDRIDNTRPQHKEWNKDNRKKNNARNSLTRYIQAYYYWIYLHRDKEKAFSEQNEDEKAA